MTDFDEYIKQGEPDKKEKGGIWQAAIGLQAVDGLKPSAYLIETARQNIEGDITLAEVKSRIDSYYKALPAQQKGLADRTEEADKVSARIAELLSEKTFSFTPIEYLYIHKRLFDGIHALAGKIRDYNISKQEWVLGGESVMYSSASLIWETLEYDFREEKNFDYRRLTKQQQLEHIAKFVSDLWQIHAFGEGNTRTTAVFAVKYLRTFGFSVGNEPFAQNSWYFRNALVRANYNDHARNVYATMEYLNRFFESLLFGKHNALKNRELHVNFGRSASPDVADNVIDNVTDRKSKIVSLMMKNSRISTAEMAKILSVDKRTILRDIAKLKQSGQISRVGNEKTGHWLVRHSKP